MPPGRQKAEIANFVATAREAGARLALPDGTRTTALPPTPPAMLPLMLGLSAAWVRRRMGGDGDGGALAAESIVPADAS
jgi:hypothetical protein